MSKKIESKKTETQSLAYFILEEFQRLVTLDKQRINKAIDVNDDVNEILKKTKKKLEERDSYKLANKYFDDTVFFTREGAVFIKLEDINKYKPYILKGHSIQTFNNVYGPQIENMIPKYTKCVLARFTADVFVGDFEICHATKRINLARPFNFKYIGDFKPKDEVKTQKGVQEIEDFILNVVCAKHVEVYEAIKKWISSMFHRQQTETLLYLVGKGGTGKTTFKNILNGMMGGASQLITDQILSGQDIFNSSMNGTSLGYVEETAGHGIENSKARDIERTLKRLSTEKFITLRRMQTEGYEVTNIINFMILTNDLCDVIPNRRTWVIEPSVERQKDTVYFANLAGIMADRDVMQVLFNKFFDVKCENFVSLVLPQTEVMGDIKNTEQMRDTYMQVFLYEHFVLNECKHKEMTTKQVYDMFKAKCPTHKKAQEHNEKYVRADIRNILLKTGGMLHKVDLFDTSKDGIMKRLAVNGWCEERIKREKDVIEARTASVLGEFEVKEEVVESNTIMSLKAEMAIMMKRIADLEKENAELKEELENPSNEVLPNDVPIPEVTVITTTNDGTSTIKKIRKNFFADMQTGIKIVKRVA